MRRNSAIVKPAFLRACNAKTLATKKSTLKGEIMRTINTIVRNRHRLRSVGVIVLLVALALADLDHGASQAAAGGTTHLATVPLSTAPLLAQTMTTIPMLPGTTQPIKVGPGNQLTPHVACSLVTYSNDDLEGTSTINYLDFATNTEHVLPGNGLERLSDTDGQRIAFTQIQADGDHIVIYDLASQITVSVPGNKNWGPAIGGNLVAFVHGLAFDSDSGEIAVYDQNTGNVTQLTSDTLSDRFPAVSPDGNVVVWEKCQPNGTGCDIYSATQIGPGSFTTRFVSGAAADFFSATNGQFLAYISSKSGENDIYFQRVEGSTEMHLSIPGDQRDLRMSGNLLVFESQTADLSYDVFLYDLSSARLYQVTNTPGTSETLSDIVAGCDGLNRIVYAIPGAGDFDVYAFNFQLSDSITDQLNDLIAVVQSFDLPEGTEASLLSKLQDALAAVNASDTASACDSLTAFINASQAQLGKKLTANQVKQLVDSATQVQTDLGCQ
jgi:hypothetical protein